MTGRTTFQASSMTCGIPVPQNLFEIGRTAICVELSGLLDPRSGGTVLDDRRLQKHQRVPPVGPSGLNPGEAKVEPCQLRKILPGRPGHRTGLLQVPGTEEGLEELRTDIAVRRQQPRQLAILSGRVARPVEQ